jgi:rhodanese-related sulfurtransferase
VIEQISVTELKELMDTASPRMIDVREKWEFDAGHVPGAEWIPMSLVPLRKQEFTVNAPVYLVCRTGNRSGQVAMWLAHQGIRSINVAGGTEAWARLGYPIDTEQNAERIR